MSDAPTMPDFTKTATAALIGCAAWLERPALIVNKIKPFVGVKINQNTHLTYPLMWLNIYA